MLLDAEQHRYNPHFVKRFGAEGALILSQLLYWQEDGKGHDPFGWIYKSLEEWYEETGLKRRQVERARKSLKDAGVLKYEKRSGVPPRYFYHIDYVRLWEALDEPSDRRPRDDRGRLLSNGGQQEDAIREKVEKSRKEAALLSNGGQHNLPTAGQHNLSTVGQNDLSTVGQNKQRLHPQSTAERTFKESSLQEAGAPLSASAPAPEIYGIKERIDRKAFINSCNRHPEWSDKETSANELAAKAMHDIGAPSHLRKDYEALASEYLSSWLGF